MEWIKKFTEMIFPLNRDKLNIEGAFFIKNQHLPNSVFKYREVNDHSLKNLEEDTVWLADPRSFNDPYDCSHTVDFSCVQKQRSSEIFDQLIKGQVDDLNLTSKQIEKLELSQDPINELIDALLSSEPMEKREGIKSVLTDILKKIHEDLALSNSEKIASSFKLCSFSEKNDSMLMWAHYAYYTHGV